MARTREEDARRAYEVGLERVKNTPAPAGQKFAIATEVHITADLGVSMAHFRSNINAIVLYTYAHAYGGTDVKSYCLDIPGHGRVAWYEEWQLEPIEEGPQDGKRNQKTTPVNQEKTQEKEKT